MRRVVSIILTVLMLVSAVATVSADISSGTNGLPNPLPVNLALSLKARESGTDDEYSSSSLSLSIGRRDSNKGVDYKAILNMSGVRDLFDRDFITSILPGDGTLADEFNDGIVTTTINVTINYPEGATTHGDLETAGTLDSGAIFEEISRTVDGNTVTITYKNSDNLTVGALNSDEEGPLKDITFTLEDTVYYAEDGEYQVSVTMTGSTDVEFTSKTQTIEYRNAQATHTTNATKQGNNRPSSSASTTNYTVCFNTNGGTEVEDVTAKYGQKIEAPNSTKDGYDFTGWYTNAELTELFDFESTIKGDMILYAGWEKSGASSWFTDVYESDWFYDDVKYVYDEGLMKGISDILFDPYGPMTRAMIVTILHRMENEPEAPDSPFVDVEEGSWYEKAVGWAAQCGVTKGVSETEFAPHIIIPREQIVTMLHRYATYKGYNVVVEDEAKIESYVDYEEVSEFAFDSFKWAVDHGVVNGRSEDMIVPKEDTIRAEAAALFARIDKKYDR